LAVRDQTVEQTACRVGIPRCLFVAAQGSEN
jgi:hypothetical protein